MSAEATNSPTNVEPAGTSAAAASGPDYAQQWAAAAAMQSYYGAAQQQKQPQLGVAGGVAQNGQQQQATQAATHAYYAQMAQHPNLYAQMWAGPVRHPSDENPIPESPFRCFFFFSKCYGAECRGMRRCCDHFHALFSRHVHTHPTRSTSTERTTTPYVMYSFMYSFPYSFPLTLDEIICDHEQKQNRAWRRHPSPARRTAHPSTPT